MAEENGEKLEKKKKKKLSSQKWWIVGVAVPVLVGLIAILPKACGGDGGGTTNHVSIAGSNFEVNNVTVIMEQARQAGKELSEADTEKLKDAERLLKSQDFSKAIELLESLREKVPVPGLLNNLAVAYEGNGQGGKALDLLFQGQEDATAQTNLETMGVAQTGDPRVYVKITGFSHQNRVITLKARYTNRSDGSSDWFTLKEEKCYLVESGTTKKVIKGLAEGFGIRQFLRAGRSCEVVKKFEYPGEPPEQFDVMLPGVGSFENVTLARR